MQITKIGRDSFATVVSAWGFLMQIGKDTDLQGQPNNFLLIEERKEGKLEILKSPTPASATSHHSLD